MKSTLSLLSYRVELFMLTHGIYMWGCGPKFYLKFCAPRLLYFQNLLHFFLKTLCPNIISKVSSKIYSFLFSHFFTIFVVWVSFSCKILHRSFVFEHICTSKFFITFVRVYILFSNQLYNFQFSLSNCDLDLTWYS